MKERVLIVDTRERQGKHDSVNFFTAVKEAAEGKVRVEEGHQAIGDVNIFTHDTETGEDVLEFCIELKSVEDLSNSIRNGHFAGQRESMKKLQKKSNCRCVLVVHGDVLDWESSNPLFCQRAPASAIMEPESDSIKYCPDPKTKHKNTPIRFLHNLKSVRTCFFNTSLVHGLHTFVSPSRYATAQWLVRIANANYSAIEGTRIDPLAGFKIVNERSRKSRHRTVHTITAQVLMQVEGVGEKTAIEIANQHPGGIAQIIQIGPEETREEKIETFARQTKGVGKKRARDIFDALCPEAKKVKY